MKHFAIALLGFAACGEIQDPPELAAEAPTCRIPDNFEVMPDGTIMFEGDIVVGTIAEFEADCAAGRRWHGWDRRTLTRPDPYSTGITAAGAKWQKKNGKYEIPYKIDPSIVDGPSRVAEAAKWWGCVDTDPTCGVDPSLSFRAWKTGDIDYVHFVRDVGNCASVGIGRQRGEQFIHVVSNEPTWIVGSATSTTGKTYTWFTNGMVSKGSIAHLDDEEQQFAYTLPPSTVTTQIVGMAIAPSASVYAWYSNGTMSAGTVDDLDANIATRAYTLPPGKSTAMIAEMDIAPNSRVYTWYIDGTMSIGTSTDLDAYQAPVSFTLASGHAFADIVGVALDANVTATVWYSDGTYSSGAPTSMTLAGGNFYTSGTCPTASLAHEIGHALGLAHEQTRCDRDDHVRVFYDNIIPGKEHNYDKHVLPGGSCDPAFQDIGSYDLLSRMHYWSGGFSANGSPTMLKLVDQGLPVAKSDVVELSVDPAGQVYTWWSDQQATAGYLNDLVYALSDFAFTIPSDKQIGSIVGIGIGKPGGSVYTYYKNSTYSVGTVSDLSAVSSGTGYTLPGTHTPDDIIAIDIGPNAHVYAWYKNGKVSEGTTTNLGYYMQPTTVTFPAGKAAANLLGIGIGPTGDVFAWYTDGTYSRGSVTNLASIDPPYTFRGRLPFINSSQVLSAGDISSINYLYP